MLKESPNHLAMTGDRDYLYPLGVAISSLARHATTTVHLDYAVPRDWHSMISTADLDLIHSLTQSLNWTFEVVEVQLDASNLPRTRHISSMTFMKPAYLDVSHHPQIAFLDGDLIATGDWSELFAPMPSASLIDAAREDNMGEFERQWHPEFPPNWYFNAGVLKARPSNWQEQCTDRWRYLLDEFDKHNFAFLEQDIMNATLLGSAGHISPELNCRPAYGCDPNQARLLHFAGWWKPWLTVRAEIKALPGHLQTAYALFLEAEEYFLDHITSYQGEGEAKQWKAAKLRVRGRMNWRAHQRFIRWRLAQTIRGILQ